MMLPRFSKICELEHIKPDILLGIEGGFRVGLGLGLVGIGWSWVEVGVGWGWLELG
jgi:hypothetical protein